MFNIRFCFLSAIDHRLFDRRKGVYIHPITGDEIDIGDAIKRGLIQVQAVATSIIDETSRRMRSNLSTRIESQSQPIRPSIQREKDTIEIESVQRLPRHRRHHHTTTEEIIEQHTTNTVDKEIYINRGRLNERSQQRHIDDIIIDNSRTKYRQEPIDNRQNIHREIVIETDRHKAQSPKSQIIIHQTDHDNEVNN